MPIETPKIELGKLPQSAVKAQSQPYTLHSFFKKIAIINEQRTIKKN